MTVVGIASPPTREELTLALAGAMDETATKALRHAAALQEQGEKLVADAGRLTREANELLSGAELLGLEAGESDRELEEVADHGTTVNSRGEAVTFEVCRTAAQRLGRFTRERFQEDLALKPVVASRWIARLREQGLLEVDENDAGDVIYDFVRPEGGSSPPPRRESPEDMAERLEHAENGRGVTVAGTGRDAQKIQRIRDRTNQPGRRRPGRKN